MRSYLRLMLLGAITTLPIAVDAATTFRALSPAHRASSSDPRPNIALEIVDPADGINAASLALRVDGQDVTGFTTVTPIADGIALDYIPLDPFVHGQLVPVEVSVRTLTGRDEASFWSFHIDQRYEVGALVIDMSGEDDQDQIFGGYGLAFRLAELGYDVHWVIDRGKSYEGVDFRATTDDAPLAASPGPDGNVAARDYRAGPFVIPDPDPSTPENEAWTAIDTLVATYAYTPVLHEIRSPLQVDFMDALFVTYLPRVAVSDTGDAVTELELSRLPYFPVLAPGIIGDPGTVAGGALFRDRDDPLCGGRRRYDVYNQSHQDWNDGDPNDLAGVDGLDEFLAKQGLTIFQCRSATIENITHWITLPPDDIVEGTTAAIDPEFVTNPSFTGHPFLQTMGTIPVPGGSFGLWDKDLNEFRPNLQFLATESETDDIGYVFGAVGSGKTYYMGGHGREGVSDQRLVMNAYLYNAVYPKFERRFSTEEVRADQDNTVAVEIRAVGGSESVATILEDRLDAYSSLVPGSVALNVPGASYDYDDVARILTVDLGELNPHDFADGLLGSYQVVVHPPGEGSYAILDHTTTHDDHWGASYQLDTVGCAAVRARPALAFEKSASSLQVVAATTTRLTLRLEIANDDVSVPIHDVVVTDTLPPAVTFVPGSIAATQGSHDWGVSWIDTLTWRVGTVVPGSSAVLTFDVDVSPAFPAPLLLNDGAHLTAADPWDGPVDLSSNHLLAQAVEAGAGGRLSYSITPTDATGGEIATLDFCATNEGEKAAFQAPSDLLELRLPEALGEPTNVVAPAGWESTWDPRTRTLGWRRLEDSYELETGQSVCFAFDLLLPAEPQVYEIEIYGTIGGTPSFGDVFLSVTAAAGLLIDGPGLAAGEPCEVVVHGFRVRNTGSGIDIINLTAISAEGSTVTIYGDDDGDGQLDPGELPLADSDGDGDGDTGVLAPDEDAGLLAVIALGDAPVSITEFVTVTARSVIDPATEQNIQVQADISGFSVDISPDLPSVCQGASVTLDAGPGYQSYLWSTGEDTQTYEATPTQGGDNSWSVTVTNSFGCEANTSESVTVVPAPTPSITADRTELCAGASASLDAGPGYASYLWSTAESSQNIGVQPVVTTVYSVAVENAGGCVGADEITITVLATPIADAGPDVTICPEFAALLGSPALPGHSYQWTPSDGLDDPTTAQPEATPAATTTYTLEVTDPGGCLATAEVTVTVDAMPQPTELGNVLRLVRLGTDIEHSWDEPAGVSEITLWVATGKDRGDDNTVDVIAGGTGRYRQPGAMDLPARAFYQLGVTACGAGVGP